MDKFFSILEKKLSIIDKCVCCKKDLKYETYCYLCFNKSVYNFKINDVDDEINDFINLQNLDILNSILNKLREKKKYYLELVFKNKNNFLDIINFKKEFEKNLKLNIFNNYSELVKYTKKNIDSIFNNSKFKKKFFFDIKNIIHLDKFKDINLKFNYDKSLFILNTHNNIISLIENKIKSKLINNSKTKKSKFIKCTTLKDDTTTQGKKFAYGKLLDIINELNDDRIKLIFREYKLSNIIKNENIFFDGLIFVQINNDLHPIVIELDDKTHELLTDSKIRLNDISKNIFCFKNGISLLRIYTVNFNKNILKKVIDVLEKSKTSKFATENNYEIEKKEHFKKLTSTYDFLKFITQ